MEKRVKYTQTQKPQRANVKHTLKTQFSVPVLMLSSIVYLAHLAKRQITITLVFTVWFVHVALVKVKFRNWIPSSRLTF